MFDSYNFTNPNRQLCDKANLCQGRHSCIDNSSMPNLRERYFQAGNYQHYFFKYENYNKDFYTIISNGKLY